MKRALIGAVVGMLLAAALIEIPTLVGDGDRAELGDAYIVMLPLGLVLGGLVGLLWRPRRGDEHDQAGQGPHD